MSIYQKGSITVFLSIILLAFVTLIGSIIECGRVTISRVQSNRSASNACKSIMSEYNRDLKDWYGLFGISLYDKDIIEDKIMYYINKNLMPNEQSDRLTCNFFDYDVDEIDIIDKTIKSLINSDITKNQILKYMKYRAPILGIEYFLDKLDIISKTSESTNILKRKLAIDKRLSKYEELYADIIKDIEGYDTSKKRIIQGFVKQIRSDNQEYCTNIPDKQITARLITRLISMNKFCNGVVNCSTEKDLKKYLSDKKDLFNNILSANKRSVKNIDRFIKQNAPISKDIKSILAVINNSSEQDTICENIKDELNQVLNKLEGQGNVKSSLMRMKMKLNNNIDVLIKFIEYLDNAAASDEMDVSTIVDNVNILISNYSTDLQFEYNENDQYKVNPTGHLKQEINNNTDKLNKVLSKKDLIQKGTAMYKELPSVMYKNATSSGLRKYVIDRRAEFAYDALDEICSYGDKIKGMNKIKEDIYLNEYIINRFNSHTNKCYDGTYFENEVEYIMSGNFNEYSNVTEIKTRILMIRMVMNFIHIYTDQEKRAVTYSIAAATSGWWTLGIGTHVTQAILIGAWSYAESCIDYRQLIKGDNVAFYKNKDDWILGIDSLLDFALDKVGTYKKDSSKEKKGLNYFEYNDYIRLLLSIGVKQKQKIYRIQDLIQLNMINCHDKNFRMKDMVVNIDFYYDISSNYLFLKYFEGRRSHTRSTVCYEY